MTSLERHEARYQRRKAAREQRKLVRSATLGGIDEAMSYSELFKAGKKCCNGVRWKSSAQNFELHLFSETAVARQAIATEKWEPSPYVHFTLVERGKVRPIDAPKIKDRQLHKAYTKNVLLPSYLPSMISNNCASQKGKGLNRSYRYLKNDLRRHYKKYGREGWIILIDFHQFFPTAPHDMILKRHLDLIKDEKLRNFGDKIVKSLPGETGMPLGVEPSQAEMIALPSAIDNFMKCQMALKGFGHYMDDYYILVPPNKNPNEILAKFLEKSASMHLTVSTHKTKVVALDRPFKYCKTTFLLTETGGIVTHGNRKAMIVDRRKIKAFKRKIDSSEMSYMSVYDSVNAMMAYFKQFNDHKRILRLRRLFYALFGFSLEHINEFRIRQGV